MLKKINFGKKEKVPLRGKFVVIDGPDGSGKATQTRELIATLKQEGYKVEVVDFPQYGKPSAFFVEEYLNGKYGFLPAQAASVFYALDRFEASFQIRKWLEEGKVVVSNRYVTASAAHHGGKIADESERVKFFRWLDNLEYQIFNIPRPDLNIILHVPAEVAQKLVDKKDPEQRQYVKGKKRDLHESDLKHLQNAVRVYVQIAKLFPNTKLVQCFEGDRLLGVQEVSNRVWELVRRVVLKGFKQE